MVGFPDQKAPRPGRAKGGEVNAGTEQGLRDIQPGTVNEKKALDGLSVTLAEGDFVTIVGSNGAGKSTFFNAVAGDFFVDEGSIRLDGADITYRRLPPQPRIGHSVRAMRGHRPT